MSLKDVKVAAVGVLITISLAGVGWAFTSQAEVNTAQATQLTEHAERISKLETLIEIMVKVLDRAER